jgi:hypothetical protein
VSSSASSYGNPKPDPALTHHYPGPSAHVSAHVSSGLNNALPPLPHVPIDLIAVLSPSTAQLQHRVICTTLDFLVASLGPRDRLALVTFQVGKSGRVRKSPSLSIGRLSAFIESMANPPDKSADEFSVKSAKGEIADVVTAVNHGLDTVLQRKQKNLISGMILVCNTADSSQKPQMDLLMACTKAASLSIHSFGFGKSHDLGLLWLISNATGESYTFVCDWYKLQDCVAGCVGGMMSIGVMNLRMHAKVLDEGRFKIKKVAGVGSAVVASNGLDVGVTLGVLRFGERWEMIVELELENCAAPIPTAAGRTDSLSATDAFVQRMGLGLDRLLLSHVALGEGMMDAIMDEAPVFEVDGAFYDPAAGKTVARLAHPVLLTLAFHLPSQSANPGWSDACIVRRRAELLSHQMIMCVIVFVGQRYVSKMRISHETRAARITLLISSTAGTPHPHTMTPHLYTTRPRETH